VSENGLVTAPEGTAAELAEEFAARVVFEGESVGEA
jgi:hypothetical protein